MNLDEIARLRLQRQGLIGAGFRTPAEAVRSLCAVQAQDLPAGLWAVGQRVPGAVESDVEAALEDRSLVRTWPMRGTLHFVAAEDARWLLALLAPRMIARAAGRYRELGLDDATFGRCENAAVQALSGGRSLTRPDLYGVFQEAGVATDGQRGLHILGWLAQRGVICMGARQGKQHTVALLDDCAPSAPPLERDAALERVALRYFAGHGPATLADFTWWTGLSTADARTALALAQPRLERRVADDRTYFTLPFEPDVATGDTAHLLPVYDEYLVGYADRSAALDPARGARAGNGIFRPVVVTGGRVVGTWTRTLGARSVRVALELFDEPTGPLDSTVARYAAFLERESSVSVVRDIAQ